MHFSVGSSLHAGLNVTESATIRCNPSAELQNKIHLRIDIGESRIADPGSGTWSGGGGAIRIREATF